jgi:Rad3-related DNA helicase
MALTPTAEQARARDLFTAGGDLVIEAGAGTGKTSTLTLLADAAPRGALGQYVAFNKAIVADAGSKMPGHVNASTAHSLAFRAVGRR